MDYEKKYKEALEWMREIYPTMEGFVKEDAEHYFPELIGSKDERIRKDIVFILNEYSRMSEEQGFLCNKSVINDALAYLEKQKEQKPIQTENEREYVRTLKSLISDFIRGKQEVDTVYYEKIYDWLDGRHIEQKPVEPSNVALKRHQDELHDFKVFAAKQAREHHISFVHDFEWDNFCAELLSYFNEKEQQPSIKEPKYESFEDGNATGWRIKQKPAEWSEEDEKIWQEIFELCNRFGYDDDCRLLKSISRKSWKPSEEQMKALRMAIEKALYREDGLTAHIARILKSLDNDLKKLM